MLLKEHKQIHKQFEFMCFPCNYANKNWEICTNTKRVTARYKCSSVTCAIITKIHRTRLKNTTIFVLKCQYLRVTSAKIIVGITMVEKYKVSKDLQTFYKCNMCNYTIKLLFLLHNLKKRCKMNKKTTICS